MRRTVLRSSWVSRIALAGILLLVAPGAGNAQFARPWKVFLVPYSHTDVGYTAPVADVLNAQQRYLDTAMAWCYRTASNPAGSRFKWTVEITWPLDAYLSSRSQGRIDSLMELVRSGSIEIGAMHFSLQMDLCGNEELVRSLYLAGELRRRYGIPVKTALSNDTPGFTWGLAELLPKAGIPYLAVAMNSFLSDFYKTTTLPYLFYLQPPGDPSSRVLVWRCIDKQWAYLEGSVTAGVYGLYNNFDVRLTALLNSLENGGYPYNEVLLNCATGDNGAPNYAIVGNVALWNQNHPTANVRISTMSEFFDSIAAGHAAQIPVYAGDAPNWWSWTFASSATLGMATSRRVQDILPEAEAWSTIAASSGRGFGNPTPQFEHAYVQNLLYEDHNLGAINASLNAPFWAEKMGWIDSALAMGTEARASSLDALAARIRTGSDPVVAVFNGLAWPRSSIVYVDLSDPILAALGPAEVVENSQPQVALLSQVVSNRWLVFLAPAVPPLGYRTFRLVPAPGRVWTSRPLSGTTLENESYRVTVDPATGGIAGVYDKDAGRDVTSGNGQFNLYRYNSTQLPSGMAVAASDSGALVQSLTLQGSAPGASGYQSTIVLESGVKALHFSHLYSKLPPTTTESVDFMFSTSLAGGTLRYEIPFASVRVFQDELSGFRTNHYGIGRWLNVHPPANDMNLTLVSRTTPIAALSGGTFGGPIRMLSTFNDANSAYRAGTGLNLTQFCITSEHLPFHDIRSSQFGHGISVPLQYRTVPAGRSSGSLPDTGWTFLRADPPAISVTALKGAANGDGMILRLFNPSREQGYTGTIEFAYPFARSVLETSLLEEDGGAAVSSGNLLPVTLAPLEVKTYRFLLQDPAASVPGETAPASFSLEQNYPNPFNPTTGIRYQVPGTSDVRLVVYDLLGREVETLVNGVKVPGAHSIEFNAAALASGVYLYRLEAGRYLQTRKMILLK